MATPSWFTNLDGTPASDAVWEQSNDGGSNWFSPVNTPDTQAAGPTGTQRYRLNVTIPGDASNHWIVTVSGDVTDGSVNDPAHLYYDGADQGQVIPLVGPTVFRLPADPGPHVVEIWIGSSDDNGGATDPRAYGDYPSVTSFETGDSVALETAGPYARNYIYNIPVSDLPYDANDATVAAYFAAHPGIVAVHLGATFQL